MIDDAAELRAPRAGCRSRSPSTATPGVTKSSVVYEPCEIEHRGRARVEGRLERDEVAFPKLRHASGRPASARPRAPAPAAPSPGKCFGTAITFCLVVGADHRAPRTRPPAPGRPRTRARRARRCRSAVPTSIIRREHGVEPERAERRAGLGRSLPRPPRRLSNSDGAWAGGRSGNSEKSPPSCDTMTNGGTCPSSAAITVALAGHRGDLLRVEVVAALEDEAAEVLAAHLLDRSARSGPGPRTRAGRAARPCARAAAGRRGRRSSSAPTGPRPSRAAAGSAARGRTSAPAARSRRPPASGTLAAWSAAGSSLRKSWTAAAIPSPAMTASAVGPNGGI